MPLISIVMPVHNTPVGFLRECIDSVVNQRHPDWELIVVDDGSDAPTASILDEIALSDSRIRVFHTPCAGLASARNYGIDRSKGEYLCFLDSDDMLFDNALSVLADSASSSGCRIVVAGFSKDGPGQTQSAPVKIISPREAIKICLYQQGIEPSAWGKLFGREIFSKERFSDGIYYEDIDFFYRAFLAVDAICVLPQPVYFYRQHAGSFLHTWSERRLDVLRVTEQMESFLGEIDPALRAAARDRRLSANFNIFLLASRNSQNHTADSCWNFIKQRRIESLVNPHVRFKNKAGVLLSYGGRRFFRFIAECLGM